MEDLVFFIFFYQDPLVYPLWIFPRVVLRSIVIWSRFSTEVR
jgi:hypothetical protein